MPGFPKPPAQVGQGEGTTPNEANEVNEPLGIIDVHEQCGR